MPSMTQSAPYAPLVALAAGWIAFAAVFALRQRPPAARSATRTRDRAAWWGVALQAAAYTLVWAKPLQRPIGTPFGGVAILGGWPLALFVAAILAATVAFIARAVARLGKQWALAARLVEDHALITDGPYAVVRHPIYTGMAGMLLATGLAIGRPLPLAIGLAVLGAGTYVRVKAEERLLREAFGGAFEAYAARVPAVVPGWWGRRG